MSVQYTGASSTGAYNLQSNSEQDDVVLTGPLFPFAS